MSFILGLFAIGVASLTTVVVGLRRAPEAYEDEDGFHIIVQPSSNLTLAPSAFLQGSRHSRYWNAVLGLFRSGEAREQTRSRISART